MVDEQKRKERLAELEAFDAKQRRYVAFMNMQLTGWQAYKAMENCLSLWVTMGDDDYVRYLRDNIMTDPATPADWANAIELMLKEEAEGKE